MILCQEPTSAGQGLLYELRCLGKMQGNVGLSYVQQLQPLVRDPVGLVELLKILENIEKPCRCRDTFIQSVMFGYNPPGDAYDLLSFFFILGNSFLQSGFLQHHLFAFSIIYISFVSSVWVTNQGGFYPDPTFEKKKPDPDPTSEKNQIRILPNFYIIRFTFYSFVFRLKSQYN